MPQETLERIKKLPQTESTLLDAFDLVRQIPEKEEALSWNRWVRSEAMKIPSGDMYNLLYKTYLFGAQQGIFDDYCIALEWEREPQKRFYLPRRHVLKPLVDDLQDLFDGKLDFLGVSLPPRIGKLVADDTKVLTRSGWKFHGDLVVGDAVISPNGSFVKVTHVFPKHVANVRCHLSDGTYVDVHENHEWVVYNRLRKKVETLETRQMMHSDYLADGRCSYSLPHRKAVIGEEKNLPVAPYTLGAWLGDGSNRDAKVCCAPKDREVIAGILEDGYRVSSFYVHPKTGVEYYRYAGLCRSLQKVGMCHKNYRVPKRIPEEYLTASIHQRLMLLAGLLDTDGSLDREKKRYQFTTVEPALRDSFIQLVSTFGWRCCVSQYEPTLSTGGIQGKQPYWVIAFNPDRFIPCRLERKQLRAFTGHHRVGFTKFEKIDPVPGNCISVEGGLYCVGERMHPTHNSTLCIFFMTFVMGHRPDVASVMSGHSDKLTDGFYREILSILSDGETYQWGAVFPGLQVVANSAKNETIDLNTIKRFPTMTCRSVSGTLTGAVEIGTGGVLYCDDLIADLEESLNPIRLQNKYDAYLNQLKDRKKLGALELMVGTRWNVFDPLGRIQQQYADNPRYRFHVIPALNENDESNFNYKYDLGFDTEYYHDMRDSIDGATWWAKYMGQPYIREGLLFPADELLYYNGVLPDGEPDRIVAVCDTAWGGGDSLSLPIAYQYGEDVYIQDVVFNNGDKEVTRPEVVAKLKKHRPHMVRFEANNGGDEYKDKVDELLKADGIRINLSAKKAPTTQSKLARIIQYAPEIKRFYFLDEKSRDREYRAFMQELTMFVQTGKNPHDDAPDSLGMLVDFMDKGQKVASVYRRPF